ncbi:MAG: HAMP domain-containing protein [Betaproteobacteria bacterium]|nr:HAMP domain-containing protein [Betaproteobacteria bacterium]
MFAVQRLKGLSARIYVAFLVTAAVPVMVAGLIGIYYSLDALKNETLHHLDHEVSGRAANLGRFFDQVTSELLLLTSLPVVADLSEALGRADPPPEAVRQRVERAYEAFVRAYPYVYQIRFLSTDGQEIARVDRRNDRPYVVPSEALQNKSDRYYVHDSLELQAGQVYVSPLDLNIEHAKVEQPERPVIRFATPMPDRTGTTRGLIVINLHADFMLGQIQEMAGLRGGTAYLFDRAGFFISRSANDAARATGLQMQSVEVLTTLFPRSLLGTMVRGGRGTEVAGDWIVAYAPIALGRTLAERSDSSVEWVIASAFPRAKLLEAVFNLYLLYAVLALCLIATAVGGFLLSRHLLLPLSLLARETEEIAKGNFARRTAIRGNDEITDLGARFNVMAGKLEQSYRSMEEQKGHLEEEVKARTAQLECEQEARREIDRQMFQTEKMTAMGELAMGLAHEIGNPLAGMKAVVQMLGEEELAPQVRENLSRVHGEIDRLSAFLRTFHGFTAPQETHPVACRLKDALEDVLLWTRKEARARNVIIDYATCCETVPDLWADSGQLKQVLLNLVINAVQAMPAGGRIEIGMCARDAELSAAVPRMRFCVSDTGPGITPEVLPKIFDPFFTTRTDGSGLGLAVVKKIAMQHGADIFVHSEHGKGTRFELIWPVAPGAHDASVRAGGVTLPCQAEPAHA